MCAWDMDHTCVMVTDASPASCREGGDTEEAAADCVGGGAEVKRATLGGGAGEGAAHQTKLQRWVKSVSAHEREGETCLQNTKPSGLCTCLG
jgi:hypothetical protein